METNEVTGCWKAIVCEIVVTSIGRVTGVIVLFVRFGKESLKFLKTELGLKYQCVACVKVVYCELLTIFLVSV